MVRQSITSAQSNTDKSLITLIIGLKFSFKQLKNGQKKHKINDNVSNVNKLIKF